MRDGIITGNGDSRLIRANLPPTYEQFRALAAAEGLPVDVLFNALGWNVLPTFLSKINLLSDPTSQKVFNNAADHTVDEALSRLADGRISSFERIMTRGFGL